MSDEPGEPAPDFMIPLTRLHLEPLPPVMPGTVAGPTPALPPQPTAAAVPASGPAPSATPSVPAHRGALALLIALIGSGVALAVCLLGGAVSLILGVNLVGMLPGTLLGLLTSAAAWALAQIDLARMDRGRMEEAGRLRSLQGRWAGQVFSAAWGFVTYSLLVFLLGFFLGKMRY